MYAAAKTFCGVVSVSAREGEIGPRDVKALVAVQQVISRQVVVLVQEHSRTSGGLSETGAFRQRLAPSPEAPGENNDPTAPVNVTRARLAPPNERVKRKRLGQRRGGRVGGACGAQKLDPGSSSARLHRRWCARRGDKAVAMVQATQDRDSQDWGSLWRRRRGQVSGAGGWLHPKSAMGPAMVVGQAVVENSLVMLLVLDDYVVEAVPAQGTDHPLPERIGRWRARWCGEEPGAESLDAAMEVGAIDRVSVVDEESRELLGIAGRLRDALGNPAPVLPLPATTHLQLDVLFHREPSSVLVPRSHHSLPRCLGRVRMAVHRNYERAVCQKSS
jgi:hypothetical protein